MKQKAFWQRVSKKMTDKLDNIYGMSLKVFSEELNKATGLTIQDILKINEFELAVLKKRYARLVSKRDETNFDVTEAVELQKIIKSKEAKNKRYIEFANQKK